MQLTSGLLVLTIQTIQCIAGTFNVPDQTQTTRAGGKLQSGRHYRVEQQHPTEQHLKPQKLMQRMGKDFSPFWMSIERPLDHKEIFVRRDLEPRNRTDFRAFNLSGLRASLEGGNGSVGKLGAGSDLVREVMASVRKWLTVQASCPVYFEWEYVGPDYWPHWVRRGTCSYQQTTHKDPRRRPEKSCSWPPGMLCVPGQEKTLHILRWVCPTNSDALNPFSSTRSKWDDRHNFPDQGKASRGDASELFQKFLDSSASSNGTGVPTSPRDANVIAEFLRNFQKKQGKGVSNVPQKSGRDEDEVNATENWNNPTWRDKKRQAQTKCKWVKIPYPVTEDCFCSC